MTLIAAVWRVAVLWWGVGMAAGSRMRSLTLSVTVTVCALVILIGL